MNEIITKMRGLRHTLPLLTAIGLATLTACVSGRVAESTRTSGWLAKESLHCPNAQQHQGKVVGDGHCVSLIKRCSGAPNTDEWRPGQPVLNSELPAGTIIATFEGDRYPSKRGHHAAIYIEQDERGIWVWDQWVGKPVHRRLIRLRHDNSLASNSAQAYRVVTLD